MVFESTNIVLICVLAVLLFVASVTDILWYKIPNYLTFPAIMLALLLHSVSDGLHGAVICFAGILVGIVALIPMHLAGKMGAGDVKLMGAIGAVLGPAGAFKSFLFSAVAGGIYAFFILAFNRAHRVVFLKRFFTMGKTLLYTGQVGYIPPAEVEKKAKLCYGVAIAVGTMGYMLVDYMGYPSWFAFLSRF